MNKYKLSYFVFVLIVGILIGSILLFLFNPGFVIQLIGVFSLYYVIPIALLLLVVDFVFNEVVRSKTADNSLRIFKTDNSDGPADRRSCVFAYRFNQNIRNANLW